MHKEINEQGDEVTIQNSIEVWTARVVLELSANAERQAIDMDRLQLARMGLRRAMEAEGVPGNWAE